jgi:hypothetical protein
MRAAIFITCFCLVWVDARAQIADMPPPEPGTLIVADTATVPHRSTLRFERMLSSFQWNLDHQTNYTGDRWFLTVDERFRSSLIRTDRKFVRDQQDLRVLGGRRLTERFDVRASGSTLFLTDNQITGLNDASITNLYGGVGMVPVEGLTLAPYIGYTIDRQAATTDRGVSYLARLYGDDLVWSDTWFRVDGQAMLQQIDPRTIARHYLRVEADHTIDPQTSVRVQTYYTYSRREFYIPADDATRNIFGVGTNIDRRFDRRFGTAGEMRYALGEGLSGMISAAIDWRTVTRDYRYKPVTPISSYLFGTMVDEFSLSTRLGLQYTAGMWFSGGSYIQYAERSEEHGLQSVDPAIPPSFVEGRAESEFVKNNIARRTMFGTHGTFHLSRNHRITTTGTASILRYDTPSPRNFDDRDELRIVFAAGSRHELSRYLVFQTSIDAVMAHVVYLRAQRSANNNWNRVLRLSPSVTYTPAAWLQTTNAFEVLANYTIYDFEDMLTNVRSLSFRQVGWIDSTRVSLTGRTRIDVYSHYRRYDRGELSWRSFAERPIHSFEEVTIIASLRYDIRPPAIAFAGGIRYFNRNRYRYNQRAREFDSQWRTVGPTCYIFWDIGGDISMRIEGWYEFQYRDSEHVASIPNISIEIGARF